MSPDKDGEERLLDREGSRDSIDLKNPEQRTTGSMVIGQATYKDPDLRMAENKFNTGINHSVDKV